MIPKLPVLFGIQHLQQGRKCIPFIIIGADLVNLIEQHHRVFHSRLAKSVRNPSRHGPYIGLPVSPDLSLVPDTAKRNSHIRLFHRLCQRSGNRRLPGPRRAYQTEDLRTAPVCQRTHRQIFQHPLLHFLQPIMLRLQNLLGMGDIRKLFRPLIPRHLQHGFNIGTAHTGLCRIVHRLFKASDLLFDLLMHFLRSQKLLLCLFKFFGIRCSTVLTKLLSDIF